MSGVNNLYKRVSPLLNPLGKAYGQLMKARRCAYHTGVLKSYQAVCPVIAVGNISWGGTGKTPIVGWLLNWAEGKNFKAVVLSRGYKGSPPKLPFQVSSQSSPAESGDEPLMLAKAFPSATVLVDPKRTRAVMFAEKTLTPDLYIMDDGFQHLSLSRDLNIVLLTPKDMTSGWNKVIPGGTWRENEDALTDAQVILLRLNSLPSETDLSGVLAFGQQRLRDIPFFPFYFENTGLRRLCGTSKIIADLDGKAYNLLCGVGSPQGVLIGATELLGQAPQQFNPFDDHHMFTLDDLRTLCESGLDLVCTEKDAIKLEYDFPDLMAKYPIWALQVKVRFLPGIVAGLSSNFEQWWESAWAQIKQKRATGYF